MAGSSQTTTDHEVIRRWAEERGGHPASVRDTGDKGGPGLLRIDFEEKEPDDRLEPIEWDQFFEKFEESGLAFLYQDTLKSGQQSRFFKFVQREGTSREMGGRGKRGTRGQGSAAEGNDGDKGEETKPARSRKTEAKAADGGEKKTTTTRRAAPKAEPDDKAREEERARKEKAARDEQKRKETEAKKREAEKAKEEKRKEAEAKKRETERAKAEDGGEKKTTTRRRTPAKAEGGNGNGNGGGGRAGSSKTTTDPDEIRQWVEARQGHPARVRDTGGKGDPGLLRIDFDERNPDDRDARLEWIDWDEFFQKFEEAGLAFLYQDRKKSGEESRFFKFVQREGTSRDMGGRGKRGSRGSGDK